MRQNEDSFWHGTLGKVLYLIDKWSEEQNQIASGMNGMPQTFTQQKTVRSFKEIGGIL